MILEALMNLVYVILDGIMNLLDLLPDFPQTLVNSVDSFFDLLFSNMSLLGFFVRIETIKILIPLWIVVHNFEHLYTFIMWIVRKIPVINVK